nr:MAG TPA: hypothetical protein [Caudoviricetes sp.]
MFEPSVREHGWLFSYPNVKNELNIINLLWNICVYQNYYVPLQSS